jgi:hypothetical protein
MWTIARDGASLLPSAVVAAGTEAAALQRSQEAREDAEAGFSKEMGEWAGLLVGLRARRVNSPLFD